WHSQRRSGRTFENATHGGTIIQHDGILNDDQGGPLQPPGLRMAEALGEVRDSIQRNLDEKKGGSQRSNSTAWPAASTGAWTRSNLSRTCSENRSRKSRKLQAPWTRK